MEKLSKAVESLRGLVDAAPAKKTPLTSKEKVDFVHTISSTLNSPQAREHEEYGKLFSDGMSVLFLLCDEADSDVRMVAEEDINLVFRRMVRDGNATRVHVELYRELKRGGTARSVRAALSRLAHLAHLIRPSKARMFALSLVEPFKALLRRGGEESIAEALSAAAPALLDVLSPFFTDAEVGGLVEAGVEALGDPGVPARRTAAAFLARLVAAARKPRLSALLLTHKLLSSVLPMSAHHSPDLIHGVLLCLRLLCPLIKKCAEMSDYDVAKESRYNKGSSKSLPFEPTANFTVDQLLQVYELGLVHVSSGDAVVVSSALELVVAVLANCPRPLAEALSSPEGPGASRLLSPLHLHPTPSARHSRKPSLAGMSSKAGSTEDVSSIVLEIPTMALEDPKPLFQDPGFNQSHREFVGDPLGAQQDLVVKVDGGIVNTGDTGMSPGPLSDDSTDEDEPSAFSPIPPSQLDEDQEESSNPNLSRESSPMPGSLGVTVDIGEYSDSGPSWVYCARVLGRRFLLAGSPGQLQPDRAVRVSHKALALSAFASLVTRESGLMGESLERGGTDGEGQGLGDVLAYAEHGDPALRAAAAAVAAALAVHPSSPLHGKALTVLKTLIQDESGVTLRACVVGLAEHGTLAALIRMGESAQALNILHQAIKLSTNSYWLLKFSTLSYTTPRFQHTNELESKMWDSLVGLILGDDDARVRDSAAKLLPRLAKEVSLDWGTAKDERYSAAESESSSLWRRGGSGQALLGDMPAVASLVWPYSAQASDAPVALPVVIRRLAQGLATAATPARQDGIVLALLRLAEAYPPTVHKGAWGLEYGAGTEGAVGLSHLLFQLLPPAAAHSTSFYASLTRLLGILFSGQAQREVMIPHGIKGENWSLLVSPPTAGLAGDCLLHCLRLLNLYWHVLSETAPTQSSQQPGFPSPVKRTLAKAASGGAGKTGGAGVPAAVRTRLAEAAAVPHLLRLHHSLRGAYANYKSNLDTEVGRRFTDILSAALSCLGQVLEVASLGDVRGYAEEALLYLRTTMTAAPAESVTAVTQLLKALFGTNLGLVAPSAGQGGGPAASFSRTESRGAGLGRTVGQFSERVLEASERVRSETRQSKLSRHLGWLGSRGDRHVIALLKNAQSKATLSEYIRFFEPVVVQSLKLYTSSVGADLQRAVLGLVAALVSVRVNYCLLDTDFKFRGFLYQQLEAVTSDQFREAEALVPGLMSLLVVLSYEKKGDDPIVEVSKIRTFAEHLVASNQHPTSIVLPVFHTLVCDLFAVRPQQRSETADLQAHQELYGVQIIGSFAAKYVEEAEGLDLLSLLLCCLCAQDEARWRSLSRDLAERVVGVLEVGGVRWGGRVAGLSAGLALIESLNESAFRPADDLLLATLSSWPDQAQIQRDPELLERWAGARVLCLWALLLHTKEDTVLSRLAHLTSKPELLERWAGARVLCLWALLLHTKEDTVLSRLAHLTSKPELLERWAGARVLCLWALLLHTKEDTVLSRLAHLTSKPELLERWAGARVLCLWALLLHTKEDTVLSRLAHLTSKPELLERWAGARVLCLWALLLHTKEDTVLSRLAHLTSKPELLERWAGARVLCLWALLLHTKEDTVLSRLAHLTSKPELLERWAGARVLCLWALLLHTKEDTVLSRLAHLTSKPELLERWAGARVLCLWALLLHTKEDTVLSRLAHLTSKPELLERWAGARVLCLWALLLHTKEDTVLSRLAHLTSKPELLERWAGARVLCLWALLLHTKEDTVLSRLAHLTSKPELLERWAGARVLCLWALLLHTKEDTVLSRLAHLTSKPELLERWAGARVLCLWALLLHTKEDTVLSRLAHLTSKPELLERWAGARVLCLWALLLHTKEDTVLSRLAHLTSKPELLERWAGARVLCLWALLLHTKEDTVLSRLAHLTSKPELLERWAGARVLCLWALLLHTKEDTVLSRLAHLTSKPELLERWAGARVLCLWALLLHTKEDTVLSRLAHLTNLNTAAFTGERETEKEGILSSFLVAFVHRLLDALSKNRATSLLSQILAWTLEFMLHLIETSSWPRTGASLKDRIAEAEIGPWLALAEEDSGHPILSLWSRLLIATAPTQLPPFLKHLLLSGYELTQRKVLKRIAEKGESARDLALCILKECPEPVFCASGDPEVLLLFRAGWESGDESVWSSLCTAGVGVLQAASSLSSIRAVLAALDGAEAEAGSALVGPLLHLLLTPPSSLLRLPAAARLIASTLTHRLQLLLPRQEPMPAVSSALLLRLSQSFSPQQQERFPMLYRSLVQLFRKWYAEEWMTWNKKEADERSLVVPTTGKLSSLRLMQLMQRGCEAGLWRDWALGEAVGAGSSEEASVVLSSASPPALYAALLRAEEGQLREEGAEALLTGAKEALLGRLAAAATLPDTEPCPALLRPLGLLVRLHASRPTPLLTDSDLATVARFLTSLYKMKRGGVKMGEVMEVATALIEILTSRRFLDWLRGTTALPTTAFQLQTVAFVFHLINEKDGVEEGDAAAYERAWTELRTLLDWALDGQGKESLSPADWPRQPRFILRNLVLAISRLEAVSSLCRVPMEAFAMGWAPVACWEERVTGQLHLTLPFTPVYLLQHPDVLRKFIAHLSATGWLEKREFEEAWLALLGVLSFTPVGEKELRKGGSAEVEERVEASALGVDCLTGVLLQAALLSPTPGNPLTSTYLIKHRERQSGFNATKSGASLLNLKWGLRKAERRSGLGLGRSPGWGLGSGTGAEQRWLSICGGNPERVHNATRLGLGQLSTEALWSLSGILAAEKSMLLNLPPPTAPSPDKPNMATQAAQSVTEKVLGMLGGGGSPGGSGSGSGTLVDLDPLTSAAAETGLNRLPSSPSSSPEPTPTPITTLGGEEEAKETNSLSMPRSVSGYVLGASNNLDLVSCLHFVLDLYTHWLREGAEWVPLPLLWATVRSLTLLSDLFTERSQYVWLRDQLRGLWNSGRATEDELVLAFVLFGLLKCAAVLGTEDGDGSKGFLEQIMKTGLASDHLSVRLLTLHGLLLLLQSLGSDESWGLLPSLVDFLKLELQGSLACTEFSALLSRQQSIDYQLIIWSLAFYITESFQDPYSRQSFVPKFLEMCSAAFRCPTLSVVVVGAVGLGLEGLVRGRSLDGAQRAGLGRLASSLLAQPSQSPGHAITSLHLALTSVYARAAEADEAGDREPNLSAMEQLSHLFRRLCGGGAAERAAVGAVLPLFLGDHFAPGNVLNRFESKLGSGEELQSALLLRALRRLFGLLWERETAGLAGHFVLAFVPSVAASPLLLAFLAAAAPPSHPLSALFPLLLSRRHQSLAYDADLLALLLVNFKTLLVEDGQAALLDSTLEKAATDLNENSPLRIFLSHSS